MFSSGVLAALPVVGEVLLVGKLEAVTLGPIISVVESTPGKVGLYSVSVFLWTNIVSLSSESIRVLVVSISTPEHLGVFGACAISTKCSVHSGTSGGDMEIFVLDLWPKFGGNCPSFLPPGQ